MFIKFCFFMLTSGLVVLKKHIFVLRLPKLTVEILLRWFLKPICVELVARGMRWHSLKVLLRSTYGSFNRWLHQLCVGQLLKFFLSILCCDNVYCGTMFSLRTFFMHPQHQLFSILFNDCVLFVCSVRFVSNNCLDLKRLLNDRFRKEKSLEEVVDKHFLIGNPLFYKFYHFDWLLLGWYFLHIKAFKSIVDSFYLNFVKFLSYFFLIVVTAIKHFIRWRLITFL